jgi:hypothetical protein
MGLKHINLKEASDAIRQQFGNRATGFEGKTQNKKYWLIRILCIT